MALKSVIFLAGLQISDTKKHPLRCLVFYEVVAGAGFEPTTFGL